MTFLAPSREAQSYYFLVLQILKLLSYSSFSLSSDSIWSCCKIFIPQATWEAARLTCACSNSGELVSITSAEEDALVNTTAGETENTWIGAHDIGAENTFEWSDGTAWSYTNWRENHPNNGGTDGNQVSESRNDKTGVDWVKP